MPTARRPRSPKPERIRSVASRRTPFVPGATRLRVHAKLRFARAALSVASLLVASSVHAQVGGQVGGGAGRLGGDRVATRPAHDEPEETFQARVQATYVFQSKPGFRAPYSGPNSLSPARERSYSLTATAMFGWRPWAGGEVYVNPEVALGLPLSELTGLGGFPNGELARTSGRDPTGYLARAFLRQTWELGGERVVVESDQNQLGGRTAARRLVLTVGTLAVIDLFDDNSYSHDARTQFMNWSLVTHGAYDFAADARGYSRGVAIEWYDGDWAMRAGRFAMPTESNGTQLSRSFRRTYGDQLEIERGWRLAGEPGRARVLLYRNRARFGSFDDALDAAAVGGDAPSLAGTRRDRTKRGIGLNLEQRFGGWIGVFVRASANDGREETFAYTEIDRSWSGGVVLDGSRWGRAVDTFGVGVARNGLSPSHRAYLAAGGLGFFLGDGRLNYRPETIAEIYYAIGVASRAWLTFNAQRVVNPAYNADRGPVNVLGVRLHTNF